MSDSELTALRETIQRLAAASVPLGKAIDYVAQDSEDMRAELALWASEGSKRSEALQKELRESSAALAPLRRELGEVEERIKEQGRRVLAARAAVARNDVRISDMLRLATAQRR